MATTTYEHTISGLLHKRVEHFHEAERIRDRLAEIKNNIGALDRVLGTLGYEGDLDAAMPRQKRNVIFGRGELTRAIQDQLRLTTTPVTSRQIAQEIITVNGQDARDRKCVSDLVKRVSKALRALHVDDRVRKGTDQNGNVIWSRK